MTERITLTAPDGTGFEVAVARPEGTVRGGIILIHEIWGLVDHIVDVAERYAAEGYLVAAPDILSREGMAPAVGAELHDLVHSADEATRIAAQPRMREALSGSRAPEYAAWAVPALRTVVDWLEAQPGVDGRIGVTGFCFGGTYAFLLATADDRVRAVAPFYGRAPEPAQIASIHAPILALYGGHDQALMDALPGVRQAMTDAGVDFTEVVYPEAHHAFFNDTGSRYDAEAAADAWRRVREFLAARL
ncbi:dienelactone hydrolase family protein [Microbacterium sp. X-17]|uniref:dienelactone hydrolase family protein n=1 Tax=Microbacterium sp. X-17 TaxID=3144404 RepID=UPI0031F54337